MPSSGNLFSASRVCLGNQSNTIPHFPAPALG